MKTLNVILFFLLVFGLIAIAAEVKPPAVLLQEGLYAEETEGNLDKAMEIYDQIREKYNDVERISARATYQLGLCNLKKGDNKKAAQFFQEVVSYYPEQTQVAKMAQQQLDNILPPATKTSPRPIVVKTFPENFTNNVSPDINQITVTFDKKMFTGGYSWCQNNNETFPQTIGKPYFSNDAMSCTLPVKLKAGRYYRIGINTPPFLGFKIAGGDQTAQEFIFVFATADVNGNSTNIPENLIAEAKKINSTQSTDMLVQEMHNEIEPDGTIKYINPNRIENKGSEPIANTRFINSDFVTLEKIVDSNNKPLQFTTTHEGSHYEYNLTFNSPIMPGEEITYTSSGTITGLIKPVAGLKDVYQYYMEHWPQAGEPVMRIETYLLPAGAELISTTPPDMQRTEKNDRIELRQKKVIPAGGSLMTAFQYKLAGAKIDVSPQELEKIVRRAVLTISTCAETDPRITESLNSLKGLDQNSVVSELAKYLDDKEATVRRSAIFILWRGGFGSIAPAEEKLLNLCKHNENYTRGMAALTLGTIKVPSSFETLKDMTLNDKDGYVRRCAAYALGLYGDKQALPTLEKALQDSDPMVKNNAQAAITILTKLNDPNLK